MKTSFITALFILFLVLPSSAQSVKTEAGRKLKAVESSIVQAESTLKELTNSLSELSVRYSVESPEIKQVEAKIKLVKEILTRLHAEKKQLLTEKLILTLPNNQIELLKIIIMQNERIIELLESRQKP